ncbi:MAG: Pyridoxine 5'-phosphate synthase [Phycisphaerae bacterium]|nr:Pyridoxine 5'-phosphate synthase [Phycisphaerae bacterium]
MAKLGVNIDHVATVRQARRTDEPDPVWAAMDAELGGADGITFHLREDRRHIQDRDARLLKETVAVKLNMEMAIAEPIVRFAAELRPDQCTLVPEKRAELTTEGGLNVVKFSRRIKSVVRRLQARDIVVSAFIEPEEAQIRAVAECGCEAIELWTGGFAHARQERSRLRALEQLERSIALGSELGLTVHAGHGLTYRNIQPVAELPGLDEFNIGHSIVARALLVGMREAVSQMKNLLLQFSPWE